MSTEFKCSLEEFKQMTAEFCKLVEQNAYADSVDNAWKCLSLHYLSFEGSDLDVQLALSYFKYAGKRYSEYISEFSF